MTDENKPVKILNARGPTIKFTGRLIGSNSTRTAGKQAWQETEIWETVGGAWIAVLRGCSEREGEIDLTEATVIESPSRFTTPSPPVNVDLARKIAAMDALNWTFCAKKMARNMGWKLVLEVD